MAKRKKICFRRTGGNMLEGRQDGAIYRIFEPSYKNKADSPEYSVQAVDKKGLGREIFTAGHKHFTKDGAVEFCQQIAAGEIDLEAMRAQFEAEDAEKEQAAIRAAVEKAKKFRAKLDAAGLSYLDLLELEALRDNLGELAHNFLIGQDRGEGLPEC